MIDVIVVGCGFAGAIVARKLAEEQNKQVLILEKRAHIGGNMYETDDTHGVSVHLYGPHIFHTDNEKIFSHLKKYSDWIKYEHEVLGKIDGQMVPIPFNFISIERLFVKEKSDYIKRRLLENFPNKKKISILDLINSNDDEIKKFGDFVYNKVFVNYTVKQWGIPAEKIDKSVINRVPVVLGYDNRYFQDEFQYMPANGFTKIFENILNHPNIHVELNCDATDRICIDTNNNKVYFDGVLWDKPIIYTGAIDELLKYKFGALPYRSLDLVFERHDVTSYQNASVVNYPNEEEFTRITEFKKLTKQIIEGRTTILKEYPIQYEISSSKNNIPYYPIIDNANINLYNQYKECINNLKNIYLCGRLAEYKYYNMDAVIDRALTLTECIEV